MERGHFFLHIGTVNGMFQKIRMEEKVLLLRQANEIIRIIVFFIEILMVAMRTVGHRIDAVFKVMAISKEVGKDIVMVGRFKDHLVPFNRDRTADL